MTDPTIARRTLVRGSAWAVPAVVASAAVPAYAASGLTATVTPQIYHTMMARSSRNPSCNPTTRPTKGYLDTLPCNSPAILSNSDCLQDPNSSQGIWLESDQPGTARIDSLEITYTFSQDVVFEGATSQAGTAHQESETSKWDSPDILLPGWTIAATTARSITLRYAGSGVIDVSTAEPGSGFATGFFVNFRQVRCTSTLYAESTRTMVYSDAAGERHTFQRATSRRNMLAGSL